MRLFPKLSRQARQRKQRQADNHHKRRHGHKMMIAWGYEPHVLKVEPDGRIHRYYSRTIGTMPLFRSGMEMSV